MILYTAKIIKKLLNDAPLKSRGVEIKIITFFIIKFILLLSFLKIATLDNGFVIDASAQTSTLPSCLDTTTPNFSKENYNCQLFLHGLMDNGLIYPASSKTLSATNQRILLDLKKNDYHDKSISTVVSSFANNKDSGLTLMSCIAFKKQNPSLNAKPRINCLDLADMPLCNDVEKLDLKNCVKECVSKDSAGVYYKIDDYIKNHNQSCVAFLDTAVSILKEACEKINTNSPIDDCAEYRRIIEKTNKFTTRKCHQLAEGVTIQEGVNCEKLQCNLLTPGEIISYQKKECLLSDSSSSPPSSIAKGCDFSKACNTKDAQRLNNKLLCDVITDKKSVEYDSCLSQQSKLKCYQFSSAQLYASAFGYYLNVCELHSCDSNLTSVTQTNLWLDSENVIEKDDINRNYVKNYYKNIAGSKVSSIEDLGSKTTLRGIIAKLKFPNVIDPDPQIVACEPNSKIFSIGYSCTSSSKPPECGGEACNNNICYATTDCSKPININNILCSGNESKVFQKDYFDDRYNGEPYLHSNFHRPAPKNEAYCNKVTSTDLNLSCSNLEDCKNKSGGAFAFRFKSSSNDCSVPISNIFQFECLDTTKDIVSDGVNRTASTNPSIAEAGHCSNLSPRDYLGRDKDSYGKCCKAGTTVQHKKIDIYHDGYIPGEDVFWNTSELYSPKVKNKKCDWGFNEYAMSVPSPIGGLCGHESLLGAEPSDDVAYFEGYPQLLYDDGKVKYKVKICVRRSHSTRPSTCGSRYCKTWCTVTKGWPAQVCEQYCGFEECKDLVVDASNPTECNPADEEKMNTLMNTYDVNEKCAANIRLHKGASGYRVRALKFRNKICGVLDYTGVAGYDANFLSSQHKVELTAKEKRLFCNYNEGGSNSDLASNCVKKSSVCISGVLDSSGDKCVGGYDSLQYSGLLKPWRQKAVIPFSLSNGATKTENGITVKGFYDYVGRFHEEMPCAPVPRLISPPKMYNLANIDNSYRIFDIPLFATVLNGTEASFHNPKIKVTYGFSEFVLQLSPYLQQGVSLPIEDPKTDKDGTDSSPNPLNNVLDSFAEMDNANKNCNDYKNAFVKKYNALNSASKVAKSCNSTDFDKYIKFNLGLYVNPDETLDANKIYYNNYYDTFSVNDPQKPELLRIAQVSSYPDIKDTNAISKTLFNINDTDKIVPTFANNGSNTQPTEILLKTITVGGVAIGGNNPRTATLFLRKEYNSRPEICLMRRFLNKDNNHQDIKVRCFPRKITDVKFITYEKTSGVAGVNVDDNKYGQGEYKIEDGKVVEITPTIYGHKKIFFRFFDINTKSYSSEYYLDNVNYGTSNCGLIKTNSDGTTDTDLLASLASEKYQVCSERSECSRFFNECTANTIQNHRKSQLGTVIFYDYIAASCQSLQESCLSKYGLSKYENIFEIVYNKYRTAVPIKLKSNINYGFFNEICLSGKSIEHLLKEDVVAYKVDSGLGKCITQESTDKCKAYGGNGKDCNCLKTLISSNDSNYNAYGGKEVVNRKITPREAGLCVDIPLPPYCPAVNYLDFNLDKTDLLFSFPSGYDFNVNGNNQRDESNSSLGPVLMPDSNKLNVSRLIKYGVSELIDIEHYNRNFDKDLATKDKYQLYNHANFPNAFPAMVAVKGSCQGYWKKELVKGKSISPVADCVFQEKSELGKWENVTGKCIRKTCQAVDIAANSGVLYSQKNYYIVNKESYNGLFQLDYGSSYSIANSELGADNDESKGSSNGFATWRKVDVMDFDFNVEATACIPGYREVDSMSYYEIHDRPLNFPEVDLKFLKEITSYSNGKNPVRICSPHAFAEEGFWKNDHLIGEFYGSVKINQNFGTSVPSNYAVYRGNSIQNQCLRIYCPLLSSDDDDMADLRYLRGAEFKGKEGLSNKELSYPASKATDPSYYEKYYGVCREDKHFYKNGNADPYRTCDNFGNWGPVINPCINKCDAISDADAEEGGNGNAEWVEGKIEPGFAQLVEGSCLPGFVPYPYSPPRIFAKCIHDATYVYDKKQPMNFNFNCYKLDSQGELDEYGDLMLRVEQSLASSTIDNKIDVNISTELVKKAGYEISKSDPKNNIPSGLLFSNAENPLVESYNPTNGYIKTGLYSSKPIRACASIERKKPDGSVDYLTRWIAPLSSCISGCPGGILMSYDTSNPKVVIDSRINAGITSHYSNLLKKTVYLKWPSVKFGSRVVMHGNVRFNTSENGKVFLIPTAYSPKTNHENNLDFTKYEKDLRGKSDDNTGSYVVSRKCNDEGNDKGVWSDPVVGCGTFDSDDKYFTMSNYSNHKVSESTIPPSLVSDHEFIQDVDTKPNGGTDYNPQNYIIGQKYYEEDKIKVELRGFCNAKNNYYPKTQYIYGTGTDLNHIISRTENPLPQFYCKAQFTTAPSTDFPTNSVIDGSYFDFVDSNNKCQIYCSFESQSGQLRANMTDAKVVINSELDVINKNRRFEAGQKTNVSNQGYSDGAYETDTVRLFKCDSRYTSAELSSPSEEINDQLTLLTDNDYILTNNKDILCGNNKLKTPSTRQIASSSKKFNAKIPYAVCGADGNFDFNQGQKCDQQCLGCNFANLNNSNFKILDTSVVSTSCSSWPINFEGAKIMDKLKEADGSLLSSDGVRKCYYGSTQQSGYCGGYGYEMFVRVAYDLFCYDGIINATVVSRRDGTCANNNSYYYHGAYGSWPWTKDKCDSSYGADTNCWYGGNTFGKMEDK